jgi:hypothetical protein
MTAWSLAEVEMTGLLLLPPPSPAPSMPPDTTAGYLPIVKEHGNPHWPCPRVTVLVPVLSRAIPILCAPSP